MRQQKLVFLFLCAFFLFTPLVFGFWTRFIVSTTDFDVTLKPLESSSTDFTISRDMSLSNHEGRTPYIISSSYHCNGYDDNYACIDRVPDLCPYLSLEPKNEEDTESGFTQNPFGFKASGELNYPDDQIDNWNLTVTSPCFEGECPANYDASINGEPLPQSSKGQTFRCDLEVDSSDTPELVKNYLKQNIAYADASLNLISVSAVLTGEAPANKFSNVLFIPGIEASRLYTQKTNGDEKQLWEPHGHVDVVGLYLNSDGTSKDPNIYTREIIKEANTPFPLGLSAQNVYKSFSEMMDRLVSDKKISEWKSFAYDWRQDVQDIVDNGAKYQSGNVSLVATLQSLVDSSQNGKVTIITHSNGGLVAKALLKKLQDDKIAGRNNLIDDVDTLILVASPEIGTASAVPGILHGYGQSMLGGLLIDEVYARELGRNAPGAYGLLPSEAYLNRVSTSPVTFVDDLSPSGVTTKMVQTFGSAINSFQEYKDFIFGAEGRANPSIDEINLPISLSQNLFSKAENLHNNIDTFVPPTGVRVVEIAGWGLDTIASFEYYPSTSCTILNISCRHFLNERPKFTADGDGTVVVPSAQYMSSMNNNVKKYWVDLFKYNSNISAGRNHGNIFEVSPIVDFISNSIQKLPSDNSSYINITVPVDTSNRLRLSVHSPVAIDAYDANGNHTGKICPSDSDFCYVEENIPNSMYLEFGEGKYLNLPEDQMSKVKLQGTDVGTFTYDSEKILPDGTSTTSSFVDIPVTTQTQAEITLNQNTGTPQLALDVTGDGKTDFTITPNANFDPISYLKIMKTTIDSLDLSKIQVRSFDIRIDNIIKSIQKGKINRAKLEARWFKSALERKFPTPHLKYPRFKKLSKTDAQLLLDMLNKLLDNLN